MPKDFKGVMHEWGGGKLHSGSKNGPLVPHTKKGQKRALAIAFSEDRKLNGGRAPAKRKRKGARRTSAIAKAMGA